ncbi:MAG TPA: DUF4910 domain-containing protein [Candidatus Hydrogenedentes bacterium]|nr:DUF4910 domain-containing protein [Candidatus Hydrogenedentota bacterium]HOL75410.1 DUF4910 domain-containing protein [Candidatus Hydrogenedentota bacterium]
MGQTKLMSFEKHHEESLAAIGESMYGLIADLYPICRSITGKGVQQTLERISVEIPLHVEKVPSGTRVFDWTVPKEWNIRDAFIKNSKGERIVDFKKCNLHVVSYSQPVHAHMSLEALRPHLHSLPDKPDWIPYRTSYYEESWGFCVSQRFLEGLQEDQYEVCIDSSFTDGNLLLAECNLPGETEDQIVVTCNICHPSLANDTLSAVALTVFLAKHFLKVSRRHSFRFLFLPATIGTIAWLALHEQEAIQIRHGLALSNVGGPGHIHYKRSRRGNAPVDKAAEYVLNKTVNKFEIRDFVPYGYDERQFCSPGFNIPMGCLSRTPFGEYPEYHTSADDLSFVKAEYLADSYRVCLDILYVLEKDGFYVNTTPKCEPQLGRRGLYRGLGGRMGGQSLELALLWVLNYGDGHHSLLDIAQKSGFPFEMIYKAARVLEEHGLLRRQDSP